MRSKSLLAGFGLALILGSALGGCLPKSKDWLHPQVASPRKEDQLFIEDSKFCEDKIGVQPQGQEREKAMTDCLTRLGWQRKE